MNNRMKPTMNKESLKSTILAGRTVQCEAEEYPEIRTQLQELAGEWIDNKQTIYAQIALMEVKRLDKKFPSWNLLANCSLADARREWR